MGVYQPLKFRLGTNIRFKHIAYQSDGKTRMSLAGAQILLQASNATGDVFSSPIASSITNSDQGESFFDIPPSSYTAANRGDYDYEIRVYQGGVYQTLNEGPLTFTLGPFGR